MNEGRKDRRKEGMKEGRKERRKEGKKEGKEGGRYMEKMEERKGMQKRRAMIVMTQTYTCQSNKCVFIVHRAIYRPQLTTLN